MSDLIKREDAMAIAFKSPFFSNALMEEFKTIPTIDAVEVVRCQDCKHWVYNFNGCSRNPCTEPWYATDFCNYGEREGE